MNILEDIQDDKLKIRIDNTTYMTNIKSLFSDVDTIVDEKEMEMILESLYIIQSRNGQVKPYIESLAFGLLSKKHY